MTVKQRDFDIWRVEAQERIRRLKVDFDREFLGRRALRRSSIEGRGNAQSQPPQTPAFPHSPLSGNGAGGTSPSGGGNVYG